MHSDRCFARKDRPPGDRRFTWTFHLEDGCFDIENYFLDVETHEVASRAAGFRDILWHRPLLPPEGEAAYGWDYWSNLLDHRVVRVA